MSILLVDDRYENLVALKAILDQVDYRLVTATSGNDALGKLLEEDFGLVVLDVFMPTMSGFEVAELMKQRDRSRETPIIFLTAEGDEAELARRGYRMGAVDYLTKPIDADLFRARVAVFAEIHRRNRQRAHDAAAERQASEERYRFLANAIPQILLTATPDGKAKDWNDRWFEITGLSLDDSRDIGWLRAVHPEEQARVAEEWIVAVRRGAPFEMEFRLRTESGEFRWYLYRCVPEKTANGVLRGWIATGTDIEEQKRLQETAERAVATRENVLAVVSHDLRSPLSSILLTAGIIARVAPSDEIRKRVGAISRAVERMSRLIQDLLDATGIQAGNLKIERAPKSVRSVLTEAVEVLTPVAAEKEIALDAQLPAAAIEVLCDDGRLVQIISNLVGNAIKFSPALSTVTIRAVECDREVRFSIADRGPGIPEEQLRLIFQPYWMGGLAKGTGLGLYISQGLVEAHGGRLWVESVVGQGATFHFTIPTATATTRPDGRTAG